MIAPSFLPVPLKCLQHHSSGYLGTQHSFIIYKKQRHLNSLLKDYQSKGQWLKHVFRKTSGSKLQC